MEVKLQNFSWRKIEEAVELAFQQHSYNGCNNEDPQPKNHDNHILKKIEADDAVHESEVHHSQLEGSKQIFNGQQRSPQESRLIAQFQSQLEMDLANKVHMAVEKSTLPSINVQISQSEIKNFEEASAGKDWKLVVEVMFAQKSHSSNCERYKIFKGGIVGMSRKKYTKNKHIQFKNLRVNYHTTVDKNSKIIILLYYLTEGKRTVFRQVLISTDLFVVEENKLLNVDTQQALKQYFDLFGPQFMDKLPAVYKVNKNDKHTLNEEITKLQQYLLKKNKRFLNVVFLSFKFPHFCELYFKLPDQTNEQQAAQQAFRLKRTALSCCLTDAIKELQELKIENQQKPQLLCNFLNNSSKLIFRININLRRVRIFLRKQFSQILNIIVSEDFEQPQGFSKFNSAKQLKQFYLQYYSYAKKYKTNQALVKQGQFGSSGVLPNSDQHAAQAAPKKQSRRPDDEQYHEEDLEDEQQQSENQEASNEGYSGEKKNKKSSNIKKLIKKTPNNISPKENKYPTRGKVRTQQPESQNNESKRNALAKKAKEKEAQKKVSMPTGGGLGPGLGMINPLNPMMPLPFQMIPGGQPPMMGMFPMMQQGQKKDGPNPAMNGQKPAVQMGPLPIGIQGMPMGGFPGGIAFGGGMPQGMFPAGMMPANFSGLPLGMMNPNASQQPNKKQSGKDGKQQPANSNSAPKPGMPMMIPLQLGQGMGMQMPMMGGMGSPVCISGGQMIPGMPQGIMQGGQGMPIAMQGPNGQTIMVMPVMPQQLQAMNQQNNSQTSSNTSASNNQPQNQPNIQQIMAGGMPMGMMLPGMQGLQGIQGIQGIQGLQGIPGMQGMMLPQGIMIGGAPGQQLNMIGANNQPNGSTPGNPIQGLNVGQLAGLGGNGLPMGFMIPGQPSTQQNPSDPKNNVEKNASPQGNSKAPQVKKSQNNKKQQKPELPPPTASNNDNSQNQKPSTNSSGLPSFLTVNQGQVPFPPIVGSLGPSTAINQQKQAQKPKNPSQQLGFPPGVMMGLPGNGAGMMLTPEMMQQLAQGGQGVAQMGIPQVMPGLPQGIMGLPQGMAGLPQGLGALPPGLGGVPLPPGMGIITPELLNSLPPQQRQMIMQQIQQLHTKLPMGGSSMKKDDQKK